MTEFSYTDPAVSSCINRKKERKNKKRKRERTKKKEKKKKRKRKNERKKKKRKKERKKERSIFIFFTCDKYRSQSIKLLSQYLLYQFPFTQCQHLFLSDYPPRRQFPTSDLILQPVANRSCYHPSAVTPSFVLLMHKIQSNRRHNLTRLQL